MKKAFFAIFAVLTVFAMTMVSCGGGGGGGSPNVTINFDLNLGDLKPGDINEAQPAAVTIPKNSSLGDKMPKALDPQLLEESDGVYFVGWFDKKTGGSPVTKDTVFAANATVFAQWHKQDREAEYAITFYLNYARGNKDDIYIVKFVKKGEALGADWPADPPDREGFTFGGWNESDLGAGKTYDLETVFTADTDAFAKWVSKEGGGEEEGVPEGWEGTEEEWYAEINGTEKVTLENAWYVVYKFDLPEGRVWTDYAEMTAQYLVTKKTWDTRNCRGVRLLGNYLPFDFRAQEIYEPFKYAVAVYNGTPPRNYIFDNGGDNGGGGSAFPQAGPLTGMKAFEWYTYHYNFAGAKAGDYKAEGIMNPAKNEGKTFIFGVGISGQNTDDKGTTSYVKNVKLIGNGNIPALNGTPVYIKYAEDKVYPAFTGYGTSASGEYGAKASRREMVGATAIDPSWIVTIPDITVTLKNNVDSESKTVTVQQGNALTEAQLTPDQKTGNFVGWYDGEGDDANVVPATTIYYFNGKTIWAQWLDPASIATITFKYGYAGAPADLVKEIKKGKTVVPFPDNPEWNAFNGFVGWNTRADGKGITVTKDTVFNQDTTVYAIWKAKPQAPTDLVYLSTDPALADVALVKVAKRNTTALNTWGTTADLQWKISDMGIPSGYDLTSYSSYTIKVKYYLEDGTTEVDPTTQLAVNTNVAQLKFSINASSFSDDYSGNDRCLYNIGSLSDGTPQRVYGIKESFPAKILDEFAATPILSMFIQKANGGGKIGEGPLGTDIKFIEITDIIFHTAAGGGSAGITIDVGSAGFDDTIYGAIGNTVWDVSKGNLTLKLSGYDTYRWTVNGALQAGKGDSLVLKVSDYADKINTNVTVTVLGVPTNESQIYSKTIVVKVTR